MYFDNCWVRYSDHMHRKAAVKKMAIFNCLKRGRKDYHIVNEHFEDTYTMLQDGKEMLPKNSQAEKYALVGVK